MQGRFGWGRRVAINQGRGQEINHEIIEMTPVEGAVDRSTRLSLPPAVAGSAPRPRDAGASTDRPSRPASARPRHPRSVCWRAPSGVEQELSIHGRAWLCLCASCVPACSRGWRGAEARRVAGQVRPDRFSSDRLTSRVRVPKIAERGRVGHLRFWLSAILKVPPFLPSDPARFSP
jgi:hypothetical protein